MNISEGKLDSCAQPGYTMELPSIDKFLRIFNENLTVIESTIESKLSIQRDYLVKKFSEDTEWNKRWKLIVIMPSLQVGSLPVVFHSLYFFINKYNK